MPNNMPGNVFDLKKVSRAFGKNTALHPTDLSIKRGETTVLIGPSGCGKSTLLRLMMGLELPSSGEIYFDEIRLTEDNSPELRRKLGYVIQDGGLFPHLTVEDNVLLMARYLKHDAARSAARLKELVALTKLPPDSLKRFPQQLSGGQRQRVSLIRALMLNPECLLLDEPMGALDPMIRTELQDDLKGIFTSLGKTVVLVTHDLSEAFYLGNTIVLMAAGKIVQQGAFRDLTGNPKDPFVTRFINAQRPIFEISGGPQ